MPEILAERFVNGGELTYYELQQAYLRITGSKLPAGSKPAATARRLTEQRPLRFEFEINRLRGFAWDLEDIQ